MKYEIRPMWLSLLSKLRMVVNMEEIPLQSCAETANPVRDTSECVQRDNDSDQGSCSSEKGSANTKASSEICEDSGKQERGELARSFCIDEGGRDCSEFDFVRSARDEPEESEEFKATPLEGITIGLHTTSDVSTFSGIFESHMPEFSVENCRNLAVMVENDEDEYSEFKGVEQSCKPEVVCVYSGAEDSDSEGEPAAVPTVDFLSTVAELNLEECGLDCCSLTSQSYEQPEFLPLPESITDSGTNSFLDLKHDTTCIVEPYQCPVTQGDFGQDSETSSFLDPLQYDSMHTTEQFQCTLTECDVGQEGGIISSLDPLQHDIMQTKELFECPVTDCDVQQNCGNSSSLNPLQHVSMHTIELFQCPNLRCNVEQDDGFSSSLGPPQNDSTCTVEPLQCSVTQCDDEHSLLGTYVQKCHSCSPVVSRVADGGTKGSSDLLQHDLMRTKEPIQCPFTEYDIGQDGGISSSLDLLQHDIMQTKELFQCPVTDCDVQQNGGNSSLDPLQHVTMHAIELFQCPNMHCNVKQDDGFSGSLCPPQHDNTCTVEPLQSSVTQCDDEHSLLGTYVQKCYSCSLEVPKVAGQLPSSLGTTALETLCMQSVLPVVNGTSSGTLATASSGSVPEMAFGSDTACHTGLCSNVAQQNGNCKPGMNGNDTESSVSGLDCAIKGEKCSTFTGDITVAIEVAPVVEDCIEFGESPSAQPNSTSVQMESHVDVMSEELLSGMDTSIDDHTYSFVTKPLRSVTQGDVKSDTQELPNGKGNLEAELDINDYKVVKFPPVPVSGESDSGDIQVGAQCDESDSYVAKMTCGHIYESVDATGTQEEADLPLQDSRSSRSSRSSTQSGPSWGEDRIYEDICNFSLPRAGTPGGPSDGDDIPWVSRRLQIHRQLSSSDSWGSEDFESCSSNEEEEEQKSVRTQVNGPENFKQRLLRKREQWRERRHSSKNLKFTFRKDSKENKETKPDETETESSSENKLYRWLSLRKSVNYDVERKTSIQGGNGTTSSSSYILTNGVQPANSSQTTASHVHASLPHFHHRMPRLLEEGDHENAFLSDDSLAFDINFFRRHQPPTLPPMPQGLMPEQIKRRHIVASIINSENNYVSALQRLVNDYRKPLQESKSAILSSSKLKILFYKVSEILQCHTLFRIALSECVRKWDQEERIGDVFVASFSKGIVLDLYSDFINNFSRAMEVAKQESKKKSAFADFLKMHQITSSDRLSFFGLMVKPIQRFPQFILFLQDLLKHTPQGHHDRMSLQLALTQLESLAEMLNERKREAEQYQAFRDTLRQINTKFALRSLSEGNRYLLRQDDVTQLEFNQAGMISKTKGRRLFLTNDQVICVSVVPRSGEDFLQQNERLSLKWAYPIADVEVIDNSTSPTLSRLLGAGTSRTGTISTRIPEEATNFSHVDSLCQEMNELMHDYEIVSRISALIDQLKGKYEGLNSSVIQQVSSTIQRGIHQRDEQMAWIDSCCLQFSIKTKDGRERETLTFQTDNPVVKKDWIVELRLAQLALDISNAPAWDSPENEQRPSTKMPLFVKALPVFSSKHQTEVNCGSCYAVTSSPPCRGAGRQVMYLWLCSSDGVSSHLTIFTMQQMGLKEVARADLTEVCVTALQHVPALGSGVVSGVDENLLRSHTVWLGTESHRLVIYSGMEPEKQQQLSATTVPSAVTTIKYHCDQVFVGLSSGSVFVYRRGADGSWLLNEPVAIHLGTSPITSILPIGTHVYAACSNYVHVIDCFTSHVTRNFGVHHEDCGGVQFMAHSGIGLWIAQQKSATICLYHTETFRHLQDINVAANVSRLLSSKGHNKAPSSVFVTALLASKGLLWAGTSVGVVLTIPLPRLEGVPIISGRAHISYHANAGPVTFLLALQPQACRPVISVPASDAKMIMPEKYDPHPSEHRGSTVPPLPAKLEKQQSDGSLVARKITPRLKQQLSSPIMLRHKPRELTRDHTVRLSKTLPRGLGLLGLSGSQEYDVYGVCGALLNVESYEEDSIEGHQYGGLSLSRFDSLRRSDPELAIPAQVSTLDRRVKLKASRPRSLDLSTWSVDSRASSAYTATSSGSEEGAGVGGCNSHALPKHCSPVTMNKSCSRRKEFDQQRTLIVVVGGRGYISWQKPVDCIQTLNSKDAHVVVWEMKL